ncbi:triacylglycerol lipase [Kitasatospora sp. NPDC047058]|uniref:esterase/lipase family protein n=1 Tax=Kitasatospora sp. NPDC047058 TaxID=3155620 RepID=UPI0033F05B78
MRRLAAFLVPLLLAVLVASAGNARPAAAAPGPAVPAAGAPNPVIFVHGRNADPGVWSGMIDSFRAGGYPADRLFAWGYDSSQSTDEVLSARLAAYVDGVLQRTGAARVDLVAHSLGSLPTRWYVKFGGGAAKVGHWVSLAGPNHGTTVAWLCALRDQGCRDMTPGSYVLSRLNRGSSQGTCKRGHDVILKP